MVLRDTPFPPATIKRHMRYITGSLPDRVRTHATLKFLQRCANKRYSTMQFVTRLRHSDDHSKSPFLQTKSNQSRECIWTRVFQAGSTQQLRHPDHDYEYDTLVNTHQQAPAAAIFNSLFVHQWSILSSNSDCCICPHLYLWVTTWLPVP